LARSARTARNRSALWVIHAKHSARDLRSLMSAARWILMPPALLVGGTSSQMTGSSRPSAASPLGGERVEDQRRPRRARLRPAFHAPLATDGRRQEDVGAGAVDGQVILAARGRLAARGTARPGASRCAEKACQNSRCACVVFVGGTDGRRNSAARPGCALAGGCRGGCAAEACARTRGDRGGSGVAGRGPGAGPTAASRPWSRRRGRGRCPGGRETRTPAGRMTAWATPRRRGRGSAELALASTGPLEAPAVMDSHDVGSAPAKLGGDQWAAMLVEAQPHAARDARPMLSSSRRAATRGVSCPPLGAPPSEPAPPRASPRLPTRRSSGRRHSLHARAPAGWRERRHRSPRRRGP
jgi:hypothetical protein